MHGSQEYILCATFSEYRVLESETSLELFVMCGAGVLRYRTVLMEMVSSMQVYTCSSIRSQITLATTAGTLVKYLLPTSYAQDISISRVEMHALYPDPEPSDTSSELARLVLPIVWAHEYFKIIGSMSLSVITKSFSRHMCFFRRMRFLWAVNITFLSMHTRHARP